MLWLRSQVTLARVAVDRRLWILARSINYFHLNSRSMRSGSFRHAKWPLTRKLILYYYRARYHDPIVGRFPSEDPIKFKGGINFYAYVKNLPTLLRDPSGRVCWGGGMSGSGAISAFWFGVGFEGSFYLVADSKGNQGILDCSGGGVGAVGGGAGGSVSVQLPGLFSPNCNSICDLEGGFGGVTGWAGAGITSAASGASLSNTTATFTGGGGLGVGSGAGVVGIFGDCKLIWKHHNCPTCSSGKH